MQPGTIVEYSICSQEHVTAADKVNPGTCSVCARYAIVTTKDNALERLELHTKTYLITGIAAALQEKERWNKIIKLIEEKQCNQER